MGISMWQLLIILVIVVLLFGTKRLKTLGGDLGSAIKGFKKAVNEGENETNKDDPKLENKENTSDQVIEGTAQRVDSSHEKTNT